MPQGFLMNVPLNCDPCNLACVLDQLQVCTVRMTNLSVKNCKSTEHFAFTREQGPGPNGPNPIRHDSVTIVVPTRLLEDVGNINRLPPINRCAAGCAFRPNKRTPRCCRKSWETGRGCAIEM